MKFFTARKTIVVFVLLLGAIQIQAERIIHDQDYVFKNNSDKGFTPIKFCACPKLGSWPQDIPTVGLDLGLVNYGDKGVTGLDLSLASFTKYIRGLQLSIVNNGYYIEGGQTAIFNKAYHILGLQIGIVNMTNYFNGAMQLGIFNSSEDSNSIQLGLVNKMDNGFLKYFPIINFPKNWF